MKKEVKEAIDAINEAIDTYRESTGESIEENQNLAKDISSNAYFLADHVGKLRGEYDRLYIRRKLNLEYLTYKFLANGVYDNHNQAQTAARVRVRSFDRRMADIIGEITYGRAVLGQANRVHDDIKSRNSNLKDERNYATSGS